MSFTINGYEVTADGKVFSYASNWRGYGRRELTQDFNSDGYPSVRVYINGVRKRIAVHVLVAMRYLPPRPSNEHEVRHLDGNKKNNNATNLAWGTAKENAIDRDRHGKTSRGESHAMAIKNGLTRSAIKKARKA